MSESVSVPRMDTKLGLLYAFCIFKQKCYSDKTTAKFATI